MVVGAYSLTCKVKYFMNKSVFILFLKKGNNLN